MAKKKKKKEKEKEKHTKKAKSAKGVLHIAEMRLADLTAKTRKQLAPVPKRVAPKFAAIVTEPNDG